MKNEGKLFEMTEEQLDTVTGGGYGGNTANPTINIQGNTNNVNLFGSNVYQYGGRNDVMTTNNQTANNVDLTKTWATLFSYNYPY